MLEVIRDRALAYAARQRLDLPGILGAAVGDWHICDSTTLRLDYALKDEYPGTSEYAALNIYKRFSVGLGTTIAYLLSPAREHDAPHLRVDDSWRGLGLLAGLGHASLDLLQRCERHGVHFIIRLKENWKPKVEHVARGSLSPTFTPGSDLDLLLDTDVLALDGKIIDADVLIGGGSREVRYSLVGVPVEKGFASSSRACHGALPRAPSPTCTAFVGRSRAATNSKCRACGWTRSAPEPARRFGHFCSPRWSPRS